MIKEAMKKLNDEQRKRLILALEQGFTQTVVFDDDTFVGVCVSPSEQFKILESSGDWSYGEVIKCQQ